METYLLENEAYTGAKQNLQPTNTITVSEFKGERMGYYCGELLSCPTTSKNWLDGCQIIRSSK